MITINTERAAKLILMLSSANDGEVLNAARMLTKMGIHEIAEIVKRSGAPISQPVHAFHFDFSGEMKDFVHAWQRATQPPPWSDTSNLRTKPKKNDRAKADAMRFKKETDEVIALFCDELHCSDVQVDRKSITRFLKKLPFDFVRAAVKTACGRIGGPDSEGTFRYFCGICWNEIKERQEAA